VKKQPLFEKSGAKLLLCWFLGVGHAKASEPESKSLFGSFSSEKQQLALL